MTKKIALIALLLTLTLMTGCTKRCRCIKNSGEVTYFSKEEIEAADKTCTDMRYMPGLNVLRYSYCEWTYGD